MSFIDDLDAVEKIIIKFEPYSSIFLIKKKISSDSSFSFNKDAFSDVRKEINNLNLKKLTVIMASNQKY